MTPNVYAFIFGFVAGVLFTVGLAKLLSRWDREFAEEPWNDEALREACSRAASKVREDGGRVP